MSQAVIVGDHAGQRLDNFLLGHLKSVPRSRIYRMIRSGEVRINGSRCKPSTRLQYTDSVRIPPIRIQAVSDAIYASDALAKQLRNAVVFEDDNLIVLDKPTRLAVHGGTGDAFGIAEVLDQVFRTEGMQLVHRLDKATSGCLVIAKNRPTMNAYHRWFRDNKIEKTYALIVEKAWPRRLAFVEARLERFRLENGERHVRVSDDGQSSRTEFAIQKQSKHATWLVARPLSGRTHQIRVHAQHVGHPILGDRKYGRRDFTPRPARLMLHAQALELPKIGRIETKLPANFVKFWQDLTQAD